MPPPMPNPSKRMTANPAKPVARYRPGKPVAEQESSDEEEDSEEERQQQKPQRKPQSRPHPRRPQAPVEEESEDEDEDGFVTDPDDEDDGGTAAIPHSTAKATSTSSRPALPRQQASGSDSEEEEESEDESSEEEEESSSEEEAPQRKFQRPTFIKKTDRNPASKTPVVDADTTVPQPQQSPDAEVDVQTRRLAQAELLIKDKLERDALARAQGKKAWDDDDEIIPESMVDDRDGLDPEAEYAAWKVRELKRLKRDREALIARENEIEELDRRRHLTAEEREKEDQTYLDQQRSEREAGRSEAQFLARYHHKGAFFQGDEAAEILKRRDVMGARFEDQVADKSLLPEYMRLRDMTKLGKKGRTRYTDLKGQDTGRFGEDVKRWRGSGGGPGGGGAGMDTRGLDERFLPDDHRGGAMGPTGANASTVAPRRERERESYRESEGRERDGDRNRERRKRSYSRSRSRSRSPQRRKRESVVS